ncbi:MAG: hypothetical protein OEY19_12180 [Gammaproteobacteria bacterium]|nr:hypothetical protein [Gammaproteobacteria bacterium]MDH5630231.1 hypothetical protein [Gammaproteobacteria bacterium]
MKNILNDNKTGLTGLFCLSLFYSTLLHSYLVGQALFYSLNSYHFGLLLASITIGGFVIYIFVRFAGITRAKLPTVLMTYYGLIFIYGVALEFSGNELSEQGLFLITGLGFNIPLLLLYFLLKDYRWFDFVNLFLGVIYLFAYGFVLMES